jgi:amino acid transporter
MAEKVVARGIEAASVSGEQPMALPEHPAGRLRVNAIGLKDAIVIGLASSGPTASIALTLAAIVAASSYAGPIAIVICGLPMLGIALAYRRLNRWRVNCGGTYTWAGRAISPSFGFMVGWVMLLAYFIGTISDVLPIGPYALQVIWPSQAHSSTGAAISASIWLIVVVVIAYIGIQATARLQWIFAAVEYTILLAFAIVSLVAVFGGNAHSVPFSWDWFSWHTLGGTTGLVNGVLIAVFMFSGWDSSVYVNEETRDSTRNPGRAAITSVLFLIIMYAFFTFAYEGAVHNRALQANGDNALAYIAKQLAGSPWDKIVIVGVLLSVVGATQTALISGARIAFSMGDDRTLPPALGRSHPTHRTPAIATLVFGGLALIVLWVYLKGSSSISASFDNVVSTVGLLFALFYAATGLSMAVYYRKLAVHGVGNFVSLAVVPIVSAAFLIWVVIKSVAGLGGWGGTVLIYTYVMIAIGVLLLFAARFVLRSRYFQTPTEAYEPPR